ncbi:glycosyltransferase [Pseudomonas indica]|uniref:glycosyltransferase n=1 Tax=Pseudomonas indica TaxID=137658 RepID=UPI003FD0FA07
MSKIESRVVVSVPVYNEEPYILATLRSLAAQNFTDFKVLVADNASTDGTGAICEAFCAGDPRFTYVRHPENFGASANFHYCLNNTESEFFMWLGGHDMLHPDFLGDALEKMLSDDRLSLVYGRTQWIDENDRVLGNTNGGNYIFQEPLQPHERYLKLLYALDRCEPVNQLIRRKFIDLSFRPVVSADLAFLCHLAGHGPFGRVEKTLYIRREIRRRSSTAMERMTGRDVKPDYQGLAELFVEGITTHCDIDEPQKLPLIRQVLGWMNKRFSLALSIPETLVPAPLPERIAASAEEQPLFSVVMPVYNRERYVREAIDSVLAQSDGDFELIVVDDGSTDRSIEIIESIQDPRLQLIRNHHAGGAAARNSGIAAARGEFIVWIDSDDLQAPGALAALRQAIKQFPDADIFYGDLEIFDEAMPGKRGRTRYPDYQGTSLLPRLIQANCLPNPGTAVRRALYERHGLYDVSFTRCHDFQMWTRLADTARFKKVDTILCHWRQHGESLSSAKTRAFEAKVALGMFARYPISRLYPDLSDDQVAEANWRMSRTLEALNEYEPALRLAREALALGHGDQARVLELEKRVGKAPEYLFSIILTTYNRPDLLRDALASVGRQTMKNLEVILVNDHGEPVESLLGGYDFPITYLYQGRNQGLSAARNAGLKLASGRYVAYLDDDDIYLPDHLANLAQTLEHNPGSVAYSGVIYVKEKLEGGARIELERSMPFQHTQFDKEKLFIQNYIPVNTWAHPRSMLATVGEFDTGLSAFEDWDVLLRMAARYPVVHVPEATAEVHVRESAAAGNDHMLGRERKNFLGLYEELYRRHSDLGSEKVRLGRQQLLQKFARADGRGRQAPSLEDWLKRRALTPVQQRLVEQRLQEQGLGPSFGLVLLDLQGERTRLATTVASLEGSFYRNVQVVVLSTASADALGFSGDVLTVTPENWVDGLNQALLGMSADWIGLARAGDEFTPGGLLMAGLELLNAPECRAIYCDELYRQGDGTLGAAFRPAFNLDYLLGFPAGMSRHWLFRRDVAVGAGGFDPAFRDAPEFELILRLINLGGLDGLGHVPEPLLIGTPPALSDVEAEEQAIVRHLELRGYQAAQVTSPQPGRYRIDYGHAERPLVSLLIEAGERLPQLQRCVESVLETTGYSPYEILLLESHPQAEAVSAWLIALAGLGEERIRVVRSADGSAGLADLFNLAAGQARGGYLLLLSPDTAVVEGDWLDELVNHAQRPEVGIVGGKLLGADGKIAQACSILGLEGPVGRPFVGEPLDAPGYLHRLQVAQNCSAVSRDCLMIPADLYAELGGLSEADVPLRYVDADLCLRARQAGYLTVWTPYAKLMLDRADETPATPEEQDAMYAKWLPLLARDPAYNPNLSLAQPGGFKLADTQLSWRPLSSWRPLPVVLAHPADPFGCGHYRVMQPFQAQHQAGLIEGALSMGLMHVTDLERYDPDVILLQRQIGEERLDAMRRMQIFSKAFKVYELDDYLPNLPVKSVHREKMPKDILRSLRRGLGYVDRFVVSTEALAEAFAGLHPQMRVIENRLPVPWWGGLKAERRVGERPRVGWAGGSSHTGDLEMIADVVKELAGEVDWVFFGMCPEAIRPYVKEIHKGVAIEQYPSMLASLNLDLAIAPVEENLFNECKSNLRLLEYGACGFPVVCSDLRCYRGDLPVTRVKNRFRDWVEAIRMHLADMDATAKAGDALRSVVLSEWMLEGRNLEAWRSAWLPD